MDDLLSDRLAELAVGFGANVQPDQILIVNAELGREQMARAISAAGYRAGARHVEVVYTDAFVRRARIEHGVDAAIGFAPDWALERVRRLGEEGVALITLEAAIDPAATAGLDPARLGADQSPVREAYLNLVVDRLINWCIIACPTPEWAIKVHPQLAPDAAMALLSEQIAHVCRLDGDDPVAAWGERLDRLTAVAARLTERHFSAVHFSGEGTDLTVGLLPSSRWLAAASRPPPASRITPTCPPRRCSRRLTRCGWTASCAPPSRLTLRVRCWTGCRCASKPDAPCGSTQTAVPTCCAPAPPATRVRRGWARSRWSTVRAASAGLDTVFYSTLIDENAASHIALGHAYTYAVADEADWTAANHSSIHIDFMIGSPQVAVDGISDNGERVPLLRDGEWQI